MVLQDLAANCQKIRVSPNVTFVDQMKVGEYLIGASVWQSVEDHSVRSCKRSPRALVVAWPTMCGDVPLGSLILQHGMVEIDIYFPLATDL